MNQVRQGAVSLSFSWSTCACLPYFDFYIFFLSKAVTVKPSEATDALFLHNCRKPQGSVHIILSKIEKNNTTSQHGLTHVHISFWYFLETILCFNRAKISMSSSQHLEAPSKHLPNQKSTNSILKKTM